MNIHSSDWRRKNCDICGARWDEYLEIRTYNWPTRIGLFEMNLKDVVCNTCNFAFVGEIPDNNFLNNFYSNAYYNPTEISVDFNVEERLSVISRYCNKSSRILEVGSGNGLFLKELKSQGYLAEGVDLLDYDGYPEQCRDSSGLYDTILSYYVLEHIIDPNTWLKKIYSLCHSNSILIFEVPDFELYPSHALNHEHFLFFTRYHLVQLLKKNGFKVISFLNEKSRFFGMSIVFTLEINPYYSSSVNICMPEHKAILNIFTMMKKIGDDQKKHINEIVSNLISTKKNKVYVWGANELALEIYYCLLAQNMDIEIVDSSPLKIGQKFFNTNKLIGPSENVFNFNQGRFVVISALSAYESIKSKLLKSGILEKYISSPLVIHS